MAMLEVNDIKVYYGMIQAIKGVSFHVDEGEVIALIGANGAGKTTILHTVSGLLTPKEGTITFEGQDLVKIPGKRLYPVGRLDYQTTGLLLMTDDGDLAYHLTHPKHHIPRVYEARVKGVPDQAAISRLERGVRLDDGYKTKPARVRILKQETDSAVIEFTLYEGKNHQVRRMAKAVGYPVLRLRRVAMGPLKLADLPEGKYRMLTEKEVAMLRAASGIKE